MLAYSLSVKGASMASTQSVQNAAYEQKDPLVIYKVESFHLFENMLSELNVKAVSALMRGQIAVRTQEPAPEQPEDAPQPRPEPELKETKAELPRRQNYRETKEEIPTPLRRGGRHED